jgi:tight adherence protein C
VTGLLLVGAGLGAAIALAVTALAPARPTLAHTLAVLRQPPPPADRRARLTGTIAGPLHRIGLPRPRTRQDLAVLDRDPTTYLATQAALAILGLLTPAATVAGLNLMGAAIGWTTPLWLGLLLAVGGYLTAEAGIHEDAEHRRRLMRHTLAALLDVIPPALASGAGIEQALHDSTRIARGWAARRIRDTLATARLTRQPLWQALCHLGDTTGVPELTQLAGSLQLAAGEGTRIRQALTERGQALSHRLTADLEAQAEAATERMSIPLMALTSVFLLLLIYPAIAAFRP